MYNLLSNSQSEWDRTARETVWTLRCITKKMQRNGRGLYISSAQKKIMEAQGFTTVGVPGADTDSITFAPKVHRVLHCIESASKYRCSTTVSLIYVKKTGPNDNESG